MNRIVVKIRRWAMIVAWLSVWMLAGASAAAKPFKITAGALRDWPPQYDVDADDVPRGFAIDVMSAVAELAGAQVDYRLYDQFPEMMAALQRGEIDVIPNMGITEDRKHEVAFTTPVETFAIRLFVRDASSAVRGLDTLAGHRVAVVESNQAISLLRDQRDIELVTYQDVHVAFFDLLAGRVDVLAYPQPVVESMAVETGLERRIRAVGEPIGEVRRALAVSKENEALRQKLDEATKALLASTRYQTIYARWYAVRPPYWTAQRVFWLGGGLLVCLVLGVGVWRVRTARERRRDREQLRRVEDAHDKTADRYRMVMEHASDGIMVSDASGRCVDANNRACEMLGYTREELLQLTIADVLAEGEEERQPIRVKDVLAGASHLFERQLRCKDGSILLTEISAARLSEGMLMGIVRDVTERKRAEESLREQEELLRHAQKMEAVGRLAGGIAHDFNNLLTAILSYSELLARALPEDSQQRKDASAIRDAAERGTSLTRQLLTFSRKDVAPPTVLSLDEVVDGMKDILDRLIGERVSLSTELKSSGHVRANQGHLEQVIMNLVINARDACSEGGRVVVRTGDAEVGASEAERHGVEVGPFLRLEVEDDGAGIDPDAQSRIFEPFFTTKDEGRGTGLGLSTVHAIVSRLGGFIEVESRIGEGSRFGVLFPRSDVEPSTKKSAISVESPAVEPKQTTILVVEDEVAILRVIERSLRRGGYRVLSASTAEAALEIAERGANVDLLVSDVVLPQMKGTELAALLTEKRPLLKVLFISGYTDSYLDQEQLALPGRAFLAKPFTPAALVETVRSLLGGSSDREAGA